MQKGKIGVTSENLFPIIKKFLYSDHDIFLREIVSNAVDATQKLKTLASKGEYSGDVTDLKVKVSLDTKAKTITISDNGIGMTYDEVMDNIGTIAKSGTASFMEALEQSKKNETLTPQRPTSLARSRRSAGGGDHGARGDGRRDRRRSSRATGRAGWPARCCRQRPGTGHPGGHRASAPARAHPRNGRRGHGSRGSRRSCP